MSEDIKKIVQEKYAEILDKNKVLGCGCGCGDENDFTFPDGSKDFSKNYTNLDGYEKNANYNLGCGIPPLFYL